MGGMGRPQPSAVLLFLLAGSLGCGVQNAGLSPTTPSSSVSNWQIQSGAAITNPGSIVALFGSLQIQGTTASGTFRTLSPCNPTPLQVVNYTGTLDSSGNLTLTATPTPIVTIHLAVPPIATNFASGSLNAIGTICAIALSSPAIGVEIAPVNGTFAGAVTALPATPAAPIASGNLSLVLTQSSTPNPDGQFPLTGTLTFTGGGCSQTTALAGTVSGVGITLSSGSGAASVLFNGVTNPNATQLTTGEAIYLPAPCTTGLSSTAAYTGTLTRQ
jgi:hypothetical protein